MRKEKKKDRPAGLADPDRAAYMIAWRDKHIEKQNQLIKGYEEGMSLMEALLAFALWQGAAVCGEERVARIPKKALSELLGSYRSEVQEDGEDFAVHFCPVQEPSDGGEQDAG